MSRSKKEEQLKKNERYPLNSLTTEKYKEFLHQEELARKREQKKGKK